MISRIGTLAVSLVVFGMGVWSFRLLSAERIVVANPSIEGYTEAIEWSPRSDEYRAILGTVYRDLPEGRDLETAVKELKTAVELRPRVWTHHLGLALAYEQQGSFDLGEVSLKEALRLNPRFAQLRWQAANFYLRRQRMPEAMAEFRTAVELDPSRLALAANRLIALGVAADEVGEKLVPPNRPDLLSYLNFVLREFGAEPDEAGRLAWETWQRWEQAPVAGKFEIRGLFGYIGFLMQRGELEKAKQVWEVGLKEGGLPHSPEGELVFNGGFEMRALNGGFDWVMPNHSEVYYEYDHRTRFEGLASLRLDFAGRSNLDYRGPRQNLILSPGKYRLSFVSKSDSITTDQGIYLEVYSNPGHARLAQADPILGTNEWRRQTTEFEVTEPMAAYLLLRRHPSKKFDNLLGGRLWLDEIRIRPIP